MKLGVANAPNARPRESQAKAAPRVKRAPVPSSPVAEPPPEREDDFDLCPMPVGDGGAW